MPVSPALHDLLERDLVGAGLPAWAATLRDAICARHGSAVAAVLFYGSCRRRGTPEGIADFVVLVHSYRAAHQSIVMRGVNALLPPNVYYLEAVYEGDTVRCKYALLSLPAFVRRCTRSFEGYFWARFAQPAQLAYGADAAVLPQLVSARGAALRRFASAFAPRCTGELGYEQFWADGLRASYRCELRPEPARAADTLIAADAVYYRTASAALLPTLPGISVAGIDTYSFRFARSTRALATLRWSLRRLWGRSLNVLRLLKAAGTFTDGLDYVLWKLERHSGLRIEATPRMRRYPRLAAFRLAWLVWRKGALRS